MKTVLITIAFMVGCGDVVSMPPPNTDADAATDVIDAAMNAPDTAISQDAAYPFCPDVGCPTTMPLNCSGVGSNAVCWCPQPDGTKVACVIEPAGNL